MVLLENVFVRGARNVWFGGDLWKFEFVETHNLSSKGFYPQFRALTGNPGRAAARGKAIYGYAAL